MRLLTAMLCAVLISATATLSTAGATSIAGERDMPAPVRQQRVVDDNADTRVEVQLAVLAVAGGVVVIGGTAAYLLRRRLGLTHYDPAQHQATSHH